ncbi:hypothetical protein BASA83_005378 [Batrachochytrium salamandrivorans]|nr:hypothetical protein BASA83_005378 [Batrachochytrium salamandrivorans]
MHRIYDGHISSIYCSVHDEFRRDWSCQFFSAKKPRDGTKYAQLSKIEQREAELEEKKKLKNLKGLRHLCEKAKKHEARVKSTLRKYERKNGYEKSQSYKKFQAEETITRLEAEAKQNEET